MNQETEILTDFDAVYRRNQDPWRVGTSFYEQRKRRLLLAALGQPTYTHAWDPACGTGHLAVELARRCTSVRATDASAEAVTITRRTCASAPNVTVEVVSLPLGDPRAARRPAPDLVVLAEFLYYLSPDARSSTYELVTRVAAPDAEVVAVHWRHHPHDAYCSGATIQTELDTALVQRGWRPAVQLFDPDFVLGSWRRSTSPG